MKHKYYSGEMPLRCGEYKPIEKQTRGVAGGTGSALVAWDIPWTPPKRERIGYPPNKNRQTKIPFGSDWSPVMDARPHVHRDDPDARPSDNKRRQLSTNPWASTGGALVATWRHDKPECHESPDGFGGKVKRPAWLKIPNPDPVDRLGDGSTLNGAAFDSRPWLDRLPPHIGPWVGYTNSDNDIAALSGDIGITGNTRWLGLFDVRKGRFVGRVPVAVAYLDKDGHRPGDYWTEADNAATLRRLDTKRNKEPVTEMPDLDDPDRYQIPTQQYSGRICANCLDTYELAEHQGTKTRYCSQRCRKYADNARNRGLSGTVKPQDLPADSWEPIGTTYGYWGMWAVT